ncbi:tRNA (guanosine(46)-N7)-methyltransferase TrmB [Helicovermis profundi]
MRLRNIPGAEEFIFSKKNYIIENPKETKGKWREIFGNDNPIYSEFGTGKGKFITTLAAKNPDINYIAIEYKAEVLYKAMQKVEELKLSNLKFMLFNVEFIEEAFDKDELDRIYINFCDPWHKKRHAKRRLTHRVFLNKYKTILAEDGWIHFKTDNRKLFQFSLNEFSELDLKMKNISLDLASDDFEENVTTEYEEKFMLKGNPIFRVEVSIKNL